jgi:flavodoxin
VFLTDVPLVGESPNEKGFLSLRVLNLRRYHCCYLARSVRIRTHLMSAAPLIRIAGVQLLWLIRAIGVSTMINVKTAIIVASHHHGNTRRIADAMAAALRARVIDADVANADDLLDYGIIGLGSGIYFGRPHRSIRRLASTIPADSKRVFLFSTSGLPCLSFFWHLCLKRTLKQRRAVMVGEFHCRGWDTVGPLKLFGGLNRRHPDAVDLKRAISFANGLAETCLTKGLPATPRADGGERHE